MTNKLTGMMLMVCGTLVPSTTLRAAETQDTTVIEQAIAEFVGRSADSDGSPIVVDPRLRLARCLAPLSLSWHGKARSAVKVTCTGDAGWRIYVPVRGIAPVPDLADDAVVKGDAIRVTVSARGFTLFRQGVALSSGSVGETIRVSFTEDSRRREPRAVWVIVTGRGQATL